MRAPGYEKLKGLVFFLLVGISSSALCWDTRVEEDKNKTGESSWRSIYQKSTLSLESRRKKRIIKPAEQYAEHTRIADMALEKLGVAELFGRNGSAKMDLVDLNASHFRIESMSLLQKVGDNPETVLEERTIPTPALFAGVPDFSFTIYDWLNKNELCPPGDLGKVCHRYFDGWLGNLNSTHFGSQATAMYAHYHTIALALAKNAEKLHQTLKREGETTKQAYIKFIKEKELEALAYEGYAQHFLQDRWAIGHMWERWGAPDYSQLPNKNIYVNAAIGGIAGLIHGAESFLSAEQDIPGSIKIRAGDYIVAADPLSSPQVINSKAMPMTFRHESNLAPPINAIGDERLTDMNTSKFGIEYYGKDYPIDVRRQKSEMLTCSMAGWAEVIRAFGNFGGTYGAWKASLSQYAPTFSIIPQKQCWDMWATNGSMLVGFVGEKFTTESDDISFSKISRTLFTSGAGEAIYTATTGLTSFDPRKSMIQLTYKISKAIGGFDEESTSLARGGIGSILGTEVGSAYSLPDYAEPLPLGAVVDKDKRGLDKQTIMGVFNRSHSELVCQDMYDLMADLRDTKNKRKQAACEYVADFTYEGTDRDYQGKQKEKRKYNDKEVKSICSIHNALPSYIENGDKDYPANENYPVYLNQGYVPYGNGFKPETRSSLGYSTESVSNWCKKIPVLHLSDSPELRDDNIVLEVSRNKERIRLIGQNLGERTGVVYYGLEGEEKKVLGDVYTWSETAIEVDYAQGTLEAGKDYELSIETFENIKSVGLFKVRINNDIEVNVIEKDLYGIGACGKPLPKNFTFIDFEKSIKDADAINHTNISLLQEELIDLSQEYIGFLNEEANCILEKTKNPTQKTSSQDKGENVTITGNSLHAPFILEFIVSPPLLLNDGKANGSNLGQSEILFELVKYIESMLIYLETARHRLEMRNLFMDKLNNKKEFEENTNKYGLPITVNDSPLKDILSVDGLKELEQANEGWMREWEISVKTTYEQYQKYNSREKQSFINNYANFIFKMDRDKIYSDMSTQFKDIKSYMKYSSIILNHWAIIMNGFEKTLSIKKRFMEAAHITLKGIHKTKKGYYLEENRLKKLLSVNYEAAIQSLNALDTKILQENKKYNNCYESASRTFNKFNLINNLFLGISIFYQHQEDGLFTKYRLWADATSTPIMSGFSANLITYPADLSTFEDIWEYKIKVIKDLINDNSVPSGKCNFSSFEKEVNELLTPYEDFFDERLVKETREYMLEITRN